LNPNDTEAEMGLANCHYLLENYDQAIERFELVLGKQQDDEVYYNLGDCY